MTQDWAQSCTIGQISRGVTVDPNAEDFVPEGVTVPSGLCMYGRDLVDLDPQMYEYIDRCRLAAIEQGASLREWNLFRRKLILADGFAGVVAMGKESFGVDEEIAE